MKNHLINLQQREHNNYFHERGEKSNCNMLKRERGKRNGFFYYFFGEAKPGTCPCPCRRYAYVTENEIPIYLLNNLAAFLLTTYQNYDKIACQYHTSRAAR